MALEEPGSAEVRDGGQRPAATVVVPLFNGRELVRDCLDSIPDGVQIVVVDDGSTDGAPEVVEREYPHVTVLRNDRNRGFGAACNRGLQEAQATVGVVLNSDARLTAGALDAIVAGFDDPEVGIIGARRVFPDGSHQTSAARFPDLGSIVSGSFLVNDLYRILRPRGSFRWELGMSRRDHDHDHDVDWVSGTCLAIRDRCFGDLGGFDEDYHLYVEETDLCWRAWRTGWRVRYLASPTVVHLGGGSTGDPRIHAERFIRSEARFMAKAYGPQILGRWRLARASGAAAKLVLLAVPALADQRIRSRVRWQWSALRCVVGPSWRERLPDGQ